MTDVAIPTSPDGWVKGVARTGLVAKGAVYCLAGALGIMAALQVQGATEGADKKGALNFIFAQPLGELLLGIIAAGLACYAAWRFIQAIRDTEHRGNDGKGLSRRAVYLFSGGIYGSLAFAAARMAFTHRKEHGDQKQELAATLMDQPLGPWLVGIVGLIMIGNGLYQAYRSLSGKYRKYVEQTPALRKEAIRLLARAGFWGYIARGVVWLIVGGGFVRAALDHNAQEAGGSGRIFSWMEDGRYGPWLLMAISLGLICYGIFMFLRARYQPIRYQ